MKLNMKKVFIVILVIALIALGVILGISLVNTKKDEPTEEGEKLNTTTNITNEINNTVNDITNDVTNNTVDNNTVNNTLDITNTNSVNTVDNTTVPATDNKPKEDLNSYLEKFSLICYLDSRTKDLEKELKRNEDYIDIAMLIAKEHNVPGELVNGKAAASKDTINKIVSEMRGRTITEVLKTADVLYSYDATSNQYYFNHTDTRIAHIFEVLENKTENGVVNLKYTCCFPNETQLANKSFSGLGKYVITMELRENSSFDYSKYRIQNYQFVIE